MENKNLVTRSFYQRHLSFPTQELIILSMGAVMFAASGFATIDEVTSHPIATYTNRTFIIRIVALCFTTGLVMLIGTVLTSIKIWKDYQKSKYGAIFYN